MAISNPAYGETGGAAHDERMPVVRIPAVTERSAIAPPVPAPELTERACRDWLAAMARRDEAALAAFYDATVGRVYGLALRITRQPESAAEVASDVYLQVWRRADRYDATRGMVLTWLMTICRTRALDHLRRADEAETHPEPEALRAEAPEQTSAQDLLSAVQEHAALHAALAKLEPVQRQLIALAFFRGMSHQEIAAHARLPLGTVKTYIRKALAVMREHLPDRHSARRSA
jgi:RNA polymerase sigma-70 factor (ECF subfamily)